MKSGRDRQTPCVLGGRSKGGALVDLLLALPLALVLGLLALQFLLVYQAHRAWSYALFEAARHASFERGTFGAANLGLAYGWAPMLARRANEPFEESLLRAQGYLAHGMERGWIQLLRRSPSAQAFEDWAEPELDDNGGAVAGSRVIANDNLSYRRLSQQPASGAAGYWHGEPIAAASGTTLLDATVLKFELRIGLPLVVPLSGRLLAATLRYVDGCGATSVFRLGLLFNAQLPPDRTGLSTGREWRCPFYSGTDQYGTEWPRLPIRLSGYARMQSPLEPR